MPQPTMNTLLAAARRHGATIDREQEDYGHVTVDAPAGRVWAGDFVHGLCLSWLAMENGRPEWPEQKRDAIADAVERMNYGTTPCEIDDCDVCRDAREGVDQ